MDLLERENDETEEKGSDNDECGSGDANQSDLDFDLTNCPIALGQDSQLFETSEGKKEIDIGGLGLETKAWVDFLQDFFFS